MLRLSVFLFLMAAAVISSAENQFSSDEGTRSFIGYAYDIETNELVYTEHHSYADKNIHEVLYKEVTGEVFATKTVNYEHSMYAPDFIQENLRNGERIESKKDGNQVLIRYQEDRSSSVDSNTINYSPRLIIDAGFDKYILKNWKALVSGNEMTIDYVIPSSLDHYEISIKKEDCTGDNLHCFSISSSSFFISLLSSKLILTYKYIPIENSYLSNDEILNNTIQLVSFKGRSNICDSEGNYHDVNIRYEY